MRVLIVEDNPVDVELVARILRKRLSAEVEAVHTAEEGLRRLRLEEFDAALVDFSLPGQTGLDFLRSCREHQIRTPVLMVTSRSLEEIGAQASTLGAVDCLCKDEFLTSSLPRAVTAAVEHHSAAEARSGLERERELRRQADGRICDLQRRLDRLQGAYDLMLHPPHGGGELPPHQDLIQVWADVVRLACEQPDLAQEGVEALVATLYTRGCTSDQVIELHGLACRHLAERSWECPRSASPRQVFLHILSLLLDAYRATALSARLPV